MDRRQSAMECCPAEPSPTKLVASHRPLARRCTASSFGSGRNVECRDLSGLPSTRPMQKQIKMHRRNQHPQRNLLFCCATRSREIELFFAPLPFHSKLKSKKKRARTQRTLAVIRNRRLNSVALLATLGSVQFRGPRREEKKKIVKAED